MRSLAFVLRVFNGCYERLPLYLQQCNYGAGKIEGGRGSADIEFVDQRGNSWQIIVLRYLVGKEISGKMQREVRMRAR